MTNEELEERLVKLEAFVEGLSLALLKDFYEFNKQK